MTVSSRERMRKFGFVKIDLTLIRQFGPIMMGTCKKKGKEKEKAKSKS